MILNLDTLNLATGAHDTAEDGMCLMEAVAHLAGEEHSDRPACVSPVLGDFGRSLNDKLDDELRQSLKPFIPALIGTAGDGLDETRGYLALDWLIRTYSPAWLDLAGLTGEAQQLRSLRCIADLASACSAGPVVRAAAERSRQRRGDVAWATAGDAAWDAAWDAVADVAGSAARYAAAQAGNAAGYAAWDAAGHAVADVAGSAARYAAAQAGWADALDAAGNAAGVAAGDAAAFAAEAVARAAPRAVAEEAVEQAAKNAVNPTIAELQHSVVDLFRRMVNAGKSAS